MKRTITMIICLVFFGFLLVMLSRGGFFGISKIPYLNKPLHQLRSFCGMSSLFTKEASMRVFATEYRFYQDGKWQNWQKLEEPLFEEYATTARLASLKHSRLDKHLSQNMNNIGIRQGITKMKESKEFKVFTSHLFERHNQQRKPDSLAVQYLRKYRGADSVKVLLAFKCKP